MGQFPELLKTSKDCRLGGSQLQLKFPKQVSVQDLHTPQHQTLHKVLTARIPLSTSVKWVVWSVLCFCFCSEVQTVGMGSVCD